MIVASGDNLLEAVLKGGTTHEETIDVGLSNEDSRVGLSYGATIEDSCFLCSLLRDVLGQPCAYRLMSLLGLLRRSSLASTNGPHGFVGHNNFGPVVDLLSDGSELSSINLIGFV